MRVRRRAKPKVEAQETPEIRPETAKPKKRSTGKQKHPIRMKSEATKTREEELVRQALAMRVRSMTIGQIADALGISDASASKYVGMAMAPYKQELSDLIHDEIANSLARYETLRRTYFVPAHGGEITDEKGVRRRINPDPEAARVYLRALRDPVMLLLKAKPPKLEITGSGITPNINVNVATDPMDLARRMREHIRGEFAQASLQTPKPSPPVVDVEAEEVEETSEAEDDALPVADASR